MMLLVARTWTAILTHKVAGLSCLVQVELLSYVEDTAALVLTRKGLQILYQMSKPTLLRATALVPSTEPATTPCPSIFVLDWVKVKRCYG